MARLRCHLRLNRVIGGDGLAVVAILARRKDERKNRKDTPKSSQLVPSVPPPNESRLSCGALKKNSFHNLRAPPASSAC